MSVRTIEDMIDWVEENIENDPALTKMANHVGYSEFYCSAKFHEYVGIPFKEYVFRRKLSLAAENLAKTNTRIIEIAVQYGFSSQEAFTRAFKEFMVVRLISTDSIDPIFHLSKEYRYKNRFVKTLLYAQKRSVF